MATWFEMAVQSYVCKRISAINDEVNLGDRQGTASVAIVLERRLYTHSSLAVNIELSERGHKGGGQAVAQCANARCGRWRRVSRWRHDAAEEAGGNYSQVLPEGLKALLDVYTPEQEAKRHAG